MALLWHECQSVARYLAFLLSSSLTGAVHDRYDPQNDEDEPEPEKPPEEEP